jgi:hypothetical protein
MKVSDGFARRPGSLVFGIDEVGNRQTAYQIRGTADRGEYRHAKPASPKLFKAALICCFARLSPRRPRARQSRQRTQYNRGLPHHHRKKESRPLRRPQSSGSVTAPPAPVSVVAMVVARIVGVVAMVVAMMIAVVAMMVAVAVPVPGCGWDHAADGDCANNA